MFICSSIQAQITSGKIVFERKTNLYKKYEKEDWVKTYIKEADRTKIDEFELYFNESLSVFQPQESDLKEKYSWMTAKHSVYQNFQTGERYSLKDVWGDKAHLRDTLYKRQWKITESKRNICGYTCRKAIWQYNDSTRIYAWYCNEIIPGVGPESFYGLPGAILGLATENGGVIYFAKSVEQMKPDPAILTPPTTREKIYSPQELRVKIDREFGKDRWGKKLLDDLLGYW